MGEPPANPPDTHTMFFYGTLLAPPVLYRVIFGSPHPDPMLHPSMKFLVFRSALLKNYRRHRVMFADYPAILPEEGGSVRGTVVSGLTEGDRFRLDTFEGSQYKRRTVKVNVLRGLDLEEAANEGHNRAQTKEDNEKDSEEIVEAETYVWCDPREQLEEEEWDFEEFKSEKMRAWMGLGPSWSDEEDENTTANGAGVQVDEGFADVDRAVAELEAQKNKENGDGVVNDPTGGRGANGHITRQLEKVAHWDNSEPHATDVKW